MISYPTGENSFHAPRDKIVPYQPISSLMITAMPREARMAWWQDVRPKNNLLRGRTYRRAKRFMDLCLISLSLPFILPLIWFITSLLP